MKVENLKIGRIYYMPAKYNPTSYTYGELIAITSDRKELVERTKGNFVSAITDEQLEKIKKRKEKAEKSIAAINIYKEKNFIISDFEKASDNKVSLHGITGSKAEYITSQF